MAKILVCEDDDDIRFFLKAQLEGAGHTVTETSDGDAGFGEFALGEIDIIVTDMMMPDFSGDDLVNTLNLIDDAPPVIVVTAFGDDERTQTLSKDPGVVAVLGKPWDQGELLRLVSENTRD